jgi:hypothetical protein
MKLPARIAPTALAKTIVDAPPPAMYGVPAVTSDLAVAGGDLTVETCFHSSVVFEYSIQTADVIVMCTSCGEQTHLPDSVSCRWCERGMSSPKIHGRMTAIDRTQPVSHTLDYHCRSCRGITRRAAMFPPSMYPRSST